MWNFFKSLIGYSCIFVFFVLPIIQSFIEMGFMFTIRWILLGILGFAFAVIFLSVFFSDRKSEVQLPKSTPAPSTRLTPPPNPNPYSLEELQEHLDNYCRKALRNGNLDKWKYGRDYKRYIGYLYERNGWKVIYNGAVEGNFDGGIDLICYKNNECCVIQCKRWKNAVGVEYIEKFKNAVERFQRYNFKFGEVTGVFQTTSDYTDDAYSYAEKYEIDCYINEFKSIKEYPPVKCLVRNGEKVYYLPFDKEFDRISVENGCAYKFKVADAEKAGYHYHLNRDVLLKTVPPAPRPKPQPLPMVNHYWNSDKNYPVAYFHAGYFEYVDYDPARYILILTAVLHFLPNI